MKNSTNPRNVEERIGHIRGRRKRKLRKESGLITTASSGNEPMPSEKERDRIQDQAEGARKILGVKRT